MLERKPKPRKKSGTRKKNLDEGEKKQTRRRNLDAGNYSEVGGKSFGRREKNQDARKKTQIM